jgi:16S rRNA (guanine966-N2)-methyltransferase
MIRVVAGKAGGRKLSVPRGVKVRPTADRVREALFSSLGPRVASARVLDLFAGAGALGLEALSRGADFAVFVEIDKSVRAELEKNIADLGFASKAGVIPGDALKAISLLKNTKEAFDLVFLDPPYAGTLLSKSIIAVCDASLMAPGGLIIAEHSKSQTLPDLFPSLCQGEAGRGSTPDKHGGLQKVVTKSYGDTGLTFFEMVGQ